MRLRFPGTKKAKAQPEDERSIDDLIALGRFDEARDDLLHRLSANPRDHHSKVKLGDVYAAQGSGDKALATYLAAAEDYAADGFYDKAVALLSRLQKLLPPTRSVEELLAQLEGVRRREARRQTVVEALTARERADRALGVVEAQQLWPAVAELALVQRLPEPDLRRLFLAFALVELEANEVVARQDRELEQLFVVARGALAAECLGPTGQAFGVGRFGAGSIVGERALLEHRPWSVTLRARGRSLLLALDQERLALALQGCGNPRDLLDALREQGNDRLVGDAARRLAGVA
jgi:tetratricopeptide (TPR) repeat protein